MLYNIKTGWGGIAKRHSEEIVILVSSLHRLNEHGTSFVFSDRHAYLQTASFYGDIADLDQIDWPVLQARDFKRDPEDPEKFERYQAEALVHQHLPVSSLLGVVCYNSADKSDLNKLLELRNMELRIIAKSSWYF